MQLIRIQAAEGKVCLYAFGFQCTKVGAAQVQIQLYLFQFYLRQGDAQRGRGVTAGNIAFGQFVLHLKAVLVQGALQPVGIEIFKPECYLIRCIAAHKSNLTAVQVQYHRLDLLCIQRHRAAFQPIGAFAFCTFLCDGCFGIFIRAFVHIFGCSPGGFPIGFPGGFLRGNFFCRCALCNAVLIFCHNFERAIEHQQHNNQNCKDSQHNPHRAFSVSAALFWHAVIRHRRTELCPGTLPYLFRHILGAAQFLDGLGLFFGACSIKVFFVIIQGIPAFGFRHCGQQSCQLLHIFLPCHFASSPKIWSMLAA